MARRKSRNANDRTSSEQDAHSRVYLERTQFFARKLEELGLADAVRAIYDLAEAKESSKLSWPKAQLSITSEAWNRVVSSGYAPLLYFCHPEVIISQPDLVMYYRGAALLPQKGAAYAGVHTEHFETGKATLDADTALTIARMINRHISNLIERRMLSPQEIEHLIYVSAGAQIQGSWNNAVGNGATQNVKRLLVSHWCKSGVVSTLLKKRVKNPVEPIDVDSVLINISDYYGVNFSNGSTAVFSSEPDVALRNPRGTLTGAIEIKGGTDPAGALERLGAAEKSFRRARQEAPQHPCKTILLMAAITDEVLRRIQAEPALFNSTYDLAELYVNDERLNAFRREIDELLWL